MRNFFNGLSQLQRKIVWLLLFSGTALFFVAWLILGNRSSINRNNYWISHTYDVIELISRINTRMADRQYDDLFHDLGRLQQLTIDNPTQQQYLRSVESDARTGAIDQARSTLGAMMTEERVLLVQRQQVIKQQEKRHLYTLVFGCLLAFCFIMLILVQLNKDILLRKNAESELLKSESKYRNLIENAGWVICSTDHRGIITFSSAKVSELTGYRPDELQGLHFLSLVDRSCLDKVSRHYTEQINAGTGETNMTFLIVTKDKKIKWIEQYTVLLLESGQYAGFHCMLKDVSESRLMQLELEKSEQKLKENQLWLQSILDNTTSLIFIKDLGGRYIIVNRRFLEMLNVTEERVINRTDFDFTSKEMADHYKRIDDEVIRTGQSMEIEEVIETAKGERNLLLIKFPLLDSQGNVFGISGIATDITERIHYQRQLIDATRDAQEARGMQELFLANMSHEIRTPMNGIQGMTNLLLDTELSPQQQEFAGVIKRSVNNLLVIINDVLDFSKIRAGKLAIERIGFRLSDVLDNVHAMFTHRVMKKGLAFDIGMASEMPAHLIGDPYRLNQILINLIGNAIKFTDSGSVKVSASVVRSSEDEVVMGFEVADTGIGIARQSLPYVFESFSQAGLDITRKYGGTGLGLAICKQLAQLQGGQISVKSEAGEGSSFYFEIPYGYHKEDRVDAAPAASISDYSQLLTGRRFLVVEDNEVNQKLIDHVLTKAGAEVDLTGNGEEAVQLLQADRSFDCIIMDLQMPVMDGYKATQHIRSVLDIQTPIIAMTATAMVGEQARCLETGMNDYMTKPFEFAELYRRIGILLDLPAPSRRQQA